MSFRTRWVARGKRRSLLLNPKSRWQRRWKTGRFRTVAEIREWIAGQYGVTYTEGGAYSLMRRLQCSPQGTPSAACQGR